MDLGVALGVVGQEVDRRELDRLQERVGLAATRAGRGSPARAGGRDRRGLDRRNSRSRLPVGCTGPAESSHGAIGQPDLLGIDLEPAGQPGAEPVADRLGRARQPVQRDRVAVVVQDQQRRLLDEHPRDVVEPEVGAAEAGRRPGSGRAGRASGSRGAGAAGGCASGWPAPGCPGAGSTPWCRCGAAASRRGSPGRAGGRSAGRPARGSRTGTGRRVPRRPRPCPGPSGIGTRSSEDAEQQLGVDDPLGEELGVLVAAAGLEALGVGGELGLDHAARRNRPTGWRSCGTRRPATRSPGRSRPG